VLGPLSATVGRNRTNGSSRPRAASSRLAPHQRRPGSRSGIVINPTTLYAPFDKAKCAIEEAEGFVAAVVALLLQPKPSYP
jgi:hypothetical protein